MQYIYQGTSNHCKYIRMAKGVYLKISTSLQEWRSSHVRMHYAPCYSFRL